MEEILIDGILDISALLKSPDIENIIKVLKQGRRTESPDIEELKRQYNPSDHKIFDHSYLPNKKVKTPKAKTAGTFQNKATIGKPVIEETETKEVEVNRLAFPLQKRIVNSAVSFTFGFPVELDSNPNGDGEKAVLEVIKRVNYDNKMPSFNRKMSRDLFRGMEVAEYWYVTAVDDHETYGFKSKWKLKVSKFSPWEGQKLYPFFDEHGDLIAFSREFEQVGLDAKTVVFFEVFTPAVRVLWKRENDGWVQVGPTKTNRLKKIPIVYAYQDQPEWADVQCSIERLELLLSRFAEINDYHSAPKIYVEGKLTGFAQKGEAGGLIQGEAGSKAYYLSWNHAPEAIRLEIETLLRFIYGFTQTPDISFDSVKGLHQISGVALEMLFTDAHLKVQTKREVFDEYLQRRINIQKAYIAQINTSMKAACDSLQVEPEIKPFIINDETTRINNLVAANGGKPLISQKTATMLSGMVTDPEKETAQIEAEAAKENSFNIFEPTV